MKTLRLQIRNIGMIADADIELDKPLLIFYGEIRQGKTTLLNAVKWVFGGPFPSDIIRHGCREASVIFTFEGGSITREWYIAKDQTTKAKSIVFIRDGKEVSSPVKEIEKFLNPFLLNQDHLREMSELERKRYFTDLFAVKTDDLDTEAEKAEGDARELRAKIKGYGDVDLKPVERIDATALRKKLEEIRESDREAEAEVRYGNSLIEDEQRKSAEENRQLDLISFEINAVEEHLRKLKTKRDALKQSLSAYIPKALNAYPAPTDTSAIEQQISQAAAQDVRYEQYQKNTKIAAQRKADELKLVDLESRLREIRSEKITRLQSISDSTGIDGLAFDEKGDFAYEGVAAGMLSTSQIMRLTSALSDKYPDGFSIELLDRGESLGRSIFQYIDRAKEHSMTILATVVGERPAAIPDEVGVFVIKDGAVITEEP